MLILVNVLITFFFKLALVTKLVEEIGISSEMYL